MGGQTLSNKANTHQILSDDIWQMYGKFNDFVDKIYLEIDYTNIEELRDDFSQFYIDFARRLKHEGLDKEYNDYMNICVMYEHLMARPDELIAHKDFFNNLYVSFEDLINTRINTFEEYEKKYREFKNSLSKSSFYFYTKVAIPSPYYDEEVLGKILSGIFMFIE